MDHQEDPFTAFKNTFWEIARSITFLAGIAVIELAIRPLFKGHVPIVADLTLAVLDLTFFFATLAQAIHVAGRLRRTIANSWTFHAVTRFFIRRLNRLRKTRSEVVEIREQKPLSINRPVREHLLLPDVRPKDAREDHPEHVE